MVDLAWKRLSYAEYVAIANDSPVKYEYNSGEVVAMSGGTIAHGRLIVKSEGSAHTASPPP